MKRITKKTLLVSMIVGVSAAAVVGGGALAATLSGRGAYTTLDNGYYLQRRDAVAAYTVSLPSITNAAAYSRAKSAGMAEEETVLTYQYSEPGSQNNWDIYTDAAGNRYTYHEVTGQLVSILYQKDSAALLSNAAVEETDVLAFADDYLSSLFPDFDRYQLASCEETGDQGQVQAAYRYILQYGLPVGDYFLGDRITLCFTEDGSLVDATFPKGLNGALTAEQQQQLESNLPSDEQLLEEGTRQMEEKYGDKLVNVELRNVVLREGDSGYELGVALGIQTSLPDGITISQLESFVYPLQ